MRLLQSLPKGHLHVHFDAALRPATIEEFAAADGVPSPLGGTYPDFADFGRAYRAIVELLRTPERIDRAIDEATADAARDGATILELALMPSRYQTAYGDADTAIAAIAASATRAAKRHGVWVGIISAIDRTAGLEEAMDTAQLAAKWAGRGVVGLGLQSDERGFPADDFAPAFDIARDAGLLSVPHAGELVGPDSVWQAMDVLQADRIEHGIRAIEDPALIKVLAGRDVCLDVCPSSNVQLAVVDSFETHPLRHLLKAGVACSINADDPVLFSTSVLAEYEIAREVLGLSDDLLAHCARTSISASAAPTDIKEDSLGRIDQWLTT